MFALLRLLLPANRQQGLAQQLPPTLSRPQFAPAAPTPAAPIPSGHVPPAVPITSNGALRACPTPAPARWHASVATHLRPAEQVQPAALPKLDHVPHPQRHVLSSWQAGLVLEQAVGAAGVKQEGGPIFPSELHHGVQPAAGAKGRGQI